MENSNVMPKFIPPSVPEDRSGNYWWLSPEGKFYRVKYLAGHDLWAKNYVKRDLKIPSERWTQNPYYMLIDSGWVRVGSDDDASPEDNVIEYIYKYGRELPPRLVKALKDLAIEKGYNKIYDERKNVTMNVDESIKKSDSKLIMEKIFNEDMEKLPPEFGLGDFNARKFWMSPQGDVYGVVYPENHPAWAERYLKLNGVTSNYPQGELYEKGWTRLLLGWNHNNTMILWYEIYDSMLTSTIKRYIVNLAKKLHVDYIEDRRGNNERIEEMIKKSELKNLIKEILNELEEKIPTNTENYIILGITDDKQNTVSGVNLGSEGHFHLKLKPPFDSQNQPLAQWRYKPKTNTIYLTHATDRQIESIKLHLKNKYGLTINPRITNDAGEYVGQGHSIYEADDDSTRKIKHPVSITQKTIRARPVTSRDQFDSDWDPKFQRMTLENLKNLREKARDTLKWCKKHHDDRGVVDATYKIKLYNDEINRRLSYINKKVMEGDALGYGHNVSFSDTQKERDPLNDPRLKKEENFKFKDFGGMANFGNATDVYYGTVFLGTIESSSSGYIIKMIKGPHGNIFIKQSKNNLFKTKEDAAKSLHFNWKKNRNL